MPIYTSAGSSIAISATLPTTFDANVSTGYPSLTYTNIGSVESIDEFGAEYNEVTFTALDTRLIQKFKGSYDNGSIAVTYALDNTNNGQDVVRAGRDNDNSYAISVTNQRGDVYYFTAKVMSERVNIGSADQITMGNVTLGIDRDVVLDPLTAS